MPPECKTRSMVEVPELFVRGLPHSSERPTWLGSAAFSRATLRLGKGDMPAQMEQTFQNPDRCLKAAGATWTDVVNTNTFVTDFDEFQKCADIRMRYLGVATLTSTTVGVTRLAGPDFMIEIEAVAVVNS